MNIRAGDVLPLRVFNVRADGLNGCSANLVNEYGIDAAGLCELSENGFSMWRIQNPEADFALVFELPACLPLGEMRIWNYNRVEANGSDHTACGLRAVRIFTSADNAEWTELKGEGYPYVLARAGGKPDMPPSNLAGGSPVRFSNVPARFVKLTFDARPGISNHDAENRLGNCFGLAKVRITAGEGLAAALNEPWTRAFLRRDGWAGADGIYSVSLSGRDFAQSDADTFFTFGDTLIGAARGEARSDDTMMINSSVCVVRRNDPATARFEYGADESGGPQSAFLPDPAIFGGGKELFFWMQDSVVVNGRYYGFPLLIADDPDGPEGYGFSVEGAAMVSAAIREGAVDWRRIAQTRGFLSHLCADGKYLVFGGAIFSNTAEAGAPDPDGYLYIYGHKPRLFTEDLYVCRVRPGAIEDPAAYRFYSGGDWVKQIERATVLVENTSCEFSVSPYFGSLHKGKYLLVFQDHVNSPTIAYRVSETPAGPFSEAVRLYHCPEVRLGRGIYTYNAKAHPHLSKEGELLVSYNVNSCNMGMNMRHADIYSPRFLNVREITY